MRPGASVGAAVVLAAAAWVGAVRADASTRAEADKIDGLIRRLGHDQLVEREAASKALDAIGEPAHGALRTAAASSDDAEIRHRADRLIGTITGRAAERVLRELEGTWHLITLEGNGAQVLGEDKARTFTFKGGRFELSLGGQVYQAGTVQVTDPFGSPRAADLTVSGSGGITVVAIYAVEGDTLKYCARAGGADRRPKEFGTRQGDGCNNSVWWRVKR